MRIGRAAAVLHDEESDMARAGERDVDGRVRVLAEEVGGDGAGAAWALRRIEPQQADAGDVAGIVVEIGAGHVLVTRGAAGERHVPRRGPGGPAAGAIAASAAASPGVQPWVSPSARATPPWASATSGGAAPPRGTPVIASGPKPGAVTTSNVS